MRFISSFYFFSMETLNEIMKELYYKKETFFVDMFGKIKSNQTTLYADRNNCKNRQHIEKWLAMNDLINIACYLNKDWQPDWNNTKEDKFIITLRDAQWHAQKVEQPTSFVYFKTKDIADQAINIIGNDLLETIFI